MFESSHRRRDGTVRLLEKQLRPEVIERTIQFLDVIIHQILYQEKIYHPGFSLSLFSSSSQDETSVQFSSPNIRCSVRSSI